MYREKPAEAEQSGACQPPFFPGGHGEERVKVSAAREPGEHGDCGLLENTLQKQGAGGVVKVGSGVILC